MDRPLTFQTFFCSLGLCVVVAIIPLGYAWTTVTSQMEDIEVKLKRLDNKLEQTQVCHIAEGRALANTDRIETADERVTEMERLLRECADRLREQEAQPSTGR